MTHQADSEFAALPSASAGMMEQPHSAATADPRAALREFKRTYGARMAEILEHQYPSKNDLAAAGKLFSMHFAPDWIDERLRAYETMGEFSRQEATAYWIVNRLDEDRARGVKSVAERRRSREEGQMKRADFSAIEWRRMLPANRRAIISRETGRDFAETEDDPDYRVAATLEEMHEVGVLEREE